MSSAGTLWTIPTQTAGTIIRAVAALGGVAIDLPESYVHYEDNKKPEFLAKFPHGKIPAWEGKDGFLLFEGAPIARYSTWPSSLVFPAGQSTVLEDESIHLFQLSLS
ncbi:hypothetical protein B0H17DRAFT_1040374, partial [Mycena rosella]